MTKPGAFLEELAGTIGDGLPVDWNGIDSHSDERDKPVVAQLRTLSALRLATRTTELPDRPEQEYWGQLRVLECIGRGAFGEVYRAWDTRLDREVALKLLRHGSAATERPAPSIVEEGRLLARVRHPNVVTIYGADSIGGRVGLWMELINGRTLEAMLRDGKRFTASEITRIGVELCRAVSAVHSAGLLHRDIKAHNVMVADADGRLVLMDFGTGRELDRSEANAAGTPLYLPPEVLSGAPATAASDVYAIGVLLYHLLTGRYPVHASDLPALRRAHAQRERQEIRSERPDVPQHLARIIQRAIDPESDRRYANADGLGAALAASKRAWPLRRRAYAAAAALAFAAAGWLAWDGGMRDRFHRTSSVAPIPAAAIAAADAPAIVVLPFKNDSSTSDSDDLVDGLTNEIIRNLAVIDGLQVRSQTSSFSFKNKPYSLREVGEQLRVNHAVEGSVQIDGRRLRLNVQFVQIAGDVPLWSERFDRRLEDVFAIQEEISRAVVNKLRLSLGKGQRRYQTNFDAYSLYLRARALLDRGGNENGARAAALLEQVAAKDPLFAPAYGGLADAYAQMSYQIEAIHAGKGLSPEEALPRMRAAAVKAMELDPLLAEAHAAMGLTYSREFDWRSAQKSLERAIELNPSLTGNHSNYAQWILLPLGKPQDAERVLAAALHADPLSLGVRRVLANVQVAAGRYEDAIANARQVLAVDPDYPHMNLHLARALTFSGRPAEAIAMREKYRDAGLVWLGNAYVMTGRRAEVERLAAAQDHPYREALLYAALGDKDRTFDALDRAVDVLPHRVAVLLAYPEMALLRGDVRLAALRRKLNLP